ncbi:hypothetical protein TVAG_002280 [Trichomonas vaginalis G3]|uniref:Uncharacterized protein n=1 Tax=Trichomonas vaginalis (strain ATCC PRA-98 / G3) TaxID=412133 RepID=A2FVX0_TRIV3|nr:FlxA-like protein family [Trichomonas vaginalis G3]EAX90955.1 hypothetical protein TVAG_002280 [Trichomonas vaginalis G3]KAI5548657.1 FlxA-like protein family [Trichomonas vaginalis G3]|eukprot:XP_001303885.1 hypothetical protein [Trichomonas vaginalis G3]
MSGNADEMIASLEMQLGTLKSQIDAIKKNREANDPEILQKQIDDLKKKIKDQEAHIRAIHKSREEQNCNYQDTAVTATFQFHKDADVKLGVTT